MSGSRAATSTYSQVLNSIAGFVKVESNAQNTLRAMIDAVLANDPGYAFQLTNAACDVDDSNKIYDSGAEYCNMVRRHHGGVSYPGREHDFALQQVQPGINSYLAVFGCLQSAATLMRFQNATDYLDHSGREVCTPAPFSNKTVGVVILVVLAVGLTIAAAAVAIMRWRRPQQNVDQSAATSQTQLTTSATAIAPVAPAPSVADAKAESSADVTVDLGARLLSPGGGR